MSHKNWFFHIDGESFGPFGTDAVSNMLKQHRLHFADFIWREGFTKWVRISEVDDFIGHMPAYPKSPVPTSDTEQSPPVSKSPSPIKKKNTKTEPHLEMVSQIDKHAQEKVLVTDKSWPKVRRYIRVKISAKINVEDPAIEFKVLNISEGGIFVMANKFLELGQELKFIMKTEEFKDPMSMTGVVIRHGSGEGHDGFAIEFIRLNPAYKRLIQDYIYKMYKAG